MLRCLRESTCQVTAVMKKEANGALRTLDLHTDAFVDRTSQLFLERGLELEEFSAEP